MFTGFRKEIQSFNPHPKFLISGKVIDIPTEVIAEERCE
jgi:hypothetical protein